jgi:hypothetical protein
MATTEFNSEIKAIFLNGTPRPIIDGTFRLTSGGITREAVMGAGGVLGHKETRVPGTCNFSVAFVKGTDMSVYDFKGGHIRIEYNTGDQWQMKNAGRTEEAQSAAPDGNLDLSYSGNAWEKL